MYVHADELETAKQCYDSAYFSQFACYTAGMQKIATRVFIYASIVFGIIGILVVLTLPGPRHTSSDLNVLLSRLLMATVFVILPAFALSVAGKYLNGK